MKNITFGLIQETYMLNNTSRISYGIAIFSDVNNNGTATIVDAIRDIGSDREQVATLVHCCNDLHLSAIHLHDVVEDFLADSTY